MMCPQDSGNGAGTPPGTGHWGTAEFPLICVDVCVTLEHLFFERQNVSGKSAENLH